jgi:hypothetical protein
MALQVLNLPRQIVGVALEKDGISISVLWYMLCFAPVNIVRECFPVGHHDRPSYRVLAVGYAILADGEGV